jgi:hypothetical protein
MIAARSVAAVEAATSTVAVATQVTASSVELVEAPIPGTVTSSLKKPDASSAKPRDRSCARSG